MAHKREVELTLTANMQKAPASRGFTDIIGVFYLYFILLLPLAEGSNTHAD